MNWGELERRISDYPKELSATGLSDSVQKVKRLVCDDINTLEDNDFTEHLRLSKSNFEESINDFFASLTDIADKYEKGDLLSAFKKMFHLLFDDKNREGLLPVHDMDYNSGGQKILYRVRSADDYRLYDREEMFHVPLDKRYLLGNYRYSINGFPCLYLGASLYDCWEETRRPDLERMNYVAFRHRCRIKVLEINLTKEIRNIRHVKQLIIFLLCSFPMTDDMKKFKYEYVFPELVLHSLITYNENHNDKIDGIWYLSSHYFMNPIYKDNPDIMMNLVIPVNRINTDNKFCDDIVNMFRVSDTKALYKDRIAGHVFGDNKTRPTSYQNSLFNLMEKEFASSKTEYKKIMNSYVGLSD